MKHCILLISFISILCISAHAQRLLSGTVINILDSQTVEIKSNNRIPIVIRLQGIEVPDFSHEFSDVVHNHLETLILGKEVVVDIGWIESGYLVGRLFVNKVDVSQQMLRDGAAWVAPEEIRDAQLISTFDELSSLARNEKRGIWAIEGLTRPSEMRQIVRESADPMVDPQVISAAISRLGGSIEGVFSPETFSPSQSECNGKVVDVVDGDTVKIQNSQGQILSVRLAGIDAPEKGQKYGVESKQTLSQMVIGKHVNCISSKKDRYGRLIAKLFVNGNDVNISMIQRCAAWHYKDYQNEQSAADRGAYSAAESSSRNARCGLWAGNPIKPSDFRRRRFVAMYQQLDVNVQDAAGLVTSSGTSYYHGFGSFSSSSGGSVNVRGYTRKDGTYVQSHTRSSPRRRN